jgi:2-hydroxychromene-2-carboxylate isomerase
MYPTLFFDLASPYAYLAVERAGSVFRGPVELQPILLGAIFKRRGWGSWALTGERAAGMGEVERRARAYGLPAVVWPPEWPANSLAADRAAIWVAQQGDPEPFVRTVFRHQFTRGVDIGELEVLAGAAKEVGLDPDELVAATQRPEVKATLREATDTAWELGVQGVPSVAVRGQVFYGDDRLEDAAAAAAGA